MPKAPPLTEVERAIECFARGFAFTRARTFPCEAVRLAGAWWIRDVERRNPRDYWVEEFVAAGMPPEKFLDLSRSTTRGRFKLCHIVTPASDEAAVRAEYRRLKCRLMVTEPMMLHDLTALPLVAVDSRYQVHRVTTDEHIARVNAANRNRRILRADDLLPGAAVRGYFVSDATGKPVGIVRSVSTGRDTWVAGLHVETAHRRRGLGKALMARMLHDDRVAGAECSILTASHTGAMLYPQLGYRQVATLFLYVPPR